MKYSENKNNSLSESDGMTRQVSATTSKTLSSAKNNSKKKKQDKNKKSIIVSFLQCFIYLALIVGVSCFLAVTVINMGNDIFAFKKDASVKYTITLGEYANINQISKELEKNGIIENAGLFRFYSKLKKDNGRFLTGSFELNAGMDYDTIRATLKNQVKAIDDVRLTIPEGFTVDEVIDLLVSNNIGTRERYIEVINNYDFKFDFLPAMETIDPDRTYRLEGYLFPDTYDFTPLESEEEVLSKFLRNFKSKFEKQYFEKAKKFNMSVDDVIILASMVEKEVNNTADYELVSSVFHNRLNSKSFPKLESDATINYFLPTHADIITQEMLNTVNPYNTYLYEGLPPGPICNPGYEAIAYAFYPEKTNYYYFVSQNDGTTYYASTLSEHQNNVAKARRANEAAKKN